MTIGNKIVWALIIVLGLLVGRQIHFLKEANRASANQLAMALKQARSCEPKLGGAQAALEPEKSITSVVTTNAGNTGTVTVNGVQFTGGNSIIVRDGKVTVDDKDVTPSEKEITITVNGNVERLKVDACRKISITGSSENIETQSGSVDIGGNVAGAIRTMSGNVSCRGTVGGNVTSMSGAITYQK